MIDHVPMNKITITYAQLNELLVGNINKKLEESIKEIGLINPITVKSDGLYYRLVDGFEEYNICMKLGKETILVNIEKE